jgi:hypothetical protein
VFQRFDEQRDIAAAARCLPVKKLPLRHSLILKASSRRASGNSKVVLTAKLR